MENQQTQTDFAPMPEDLKWLDGASKFLDNQFRIPGTEIRFGLDFLVGLIPGIGDLVSFGISGLLVTMMAKKGASGMVIIKMLGNIVLDAIMGTIPIIGDLFDLTYKANRKNLNLLKEHYREGDHQGSAWPVILGVLFILLLLSFGVTYLVYRLLKWSFTLI